jgi:RNA polymerase sigma factor (sigma-70 family)
MAYLARAVQNLWVDQWRRQEVIRRNYEHLLQVLEEPATPETLLVTAENRLLLRQAILALKSPYRDLLEAVLEKDTTLAELARQKKIKRGTIYTQFRRALEALQKQWKRKNALKRATS